MFCVVTYIDVGRSLTGRKGFDYLMCIREHEDHKFLQYISGIDGKEVFQLVHRHESADLKCRGSANIKLTNEVQQSAKVNKYC